MYKVATNIHVRPLPELSVCMVYRPHPPALLTLNLSAWLLFEIVRERPWEDPWPIFWAEVKHARTEEMARHDMRRCLGQLVAMRLIESIASMAGAGLGRGDKS